jgi:hypothetical protein
MNDLLDLPAQIRETSDAIAAHERALAQHPSDSLAASLRSLQKRLDRLTAELHKQNAVAVQRP